ncbi:LarC family nickel insertion protein [Desulfohalovibrio reitneri]|uniref:LarC family nickel insertion protein n=1 Tax=Desulfohalovibrio reitneri TaxID=1307759 RepID=UPI00068E4FDB|nr:LarC family nickel insertion protein [Desulfohalovibrio reitneri]
MTSDFQDKGGPLGLFLDPSGGMAGDMLLASLAALGTDLDELAGMLRAGGLDVSLALEPRQRQGLAGWGLAIDAPGAQPLRHLPDLLAVVEAMGLPPRARERTARALTRLAEAEARVHGTGIESVHFHEVGAVDTVVDVAGAFWALERLGVEEVVCAALPWFRGEVDCAHGRLPLPAPATAALLEGKPVRSTEVVGEIITPTGALLIDQAVDRFGHGPDGVLRATATAFGTREIPGAEAGLRAFLYDSAGTREGRPRAAR